MNTSLSIIYCDLGEDVRASRKCNSLWHHYDLANRLATIAVDANKMLNDNRIVVFSKINETNSSNLCKMLNKWTYTVGNNESYRYIIFFPKKCALIESKSFSLTNNQDNFLTVKIEMNNFKFCLTVLRYSKSGDTMYVEKLTSLINEFNDENFPSIICASYLNESHHENIVLNKFIGYRSLLSKYAKTWIPYPFDFTYYDTGMTLIKLNDMMAKIHSGKYTCKEEEKYINLCKKDKPRNSYGYHTSIFYNKLNASDIDMNNIFNSSQLAISANFF